MRRGARIASYIGVGMLAGLLVAILAIQVLTRSEWGHERARRFALGWLAERVHGTVTVGRITGTGLLAGLTLHDVAIVDARGRPFLAADSILAAYNWRTLVSGQIVLDRVRAFRPVVYLEQLPGDTAWNYQYIFADTTPRDTLRPSERTLVMFRDTRIHGGFATVRTPIDSDRRIDPADTARVILEPVPGGLAKVMRFENIQAHLDRIVWEQPRHEGKLFEVRSATGTGYVYREPLTLRGARGKVALRDSTITIDFSRVELPSSSAALFGNVVHTRGQNYYDIQIDADRFAFADIAWVYPGMPEQGGGSARIRVQSQRALNSTLWLAENASIRTEGTTLAGTFGIVTGDTTYFTRVDLRASPLDVAVLERLVPGGLPVEGLLVGTVEVKGPLSALETEGELRFASGPSAGSSMRWAGTVDARRGRLGARGLRADVRGFDLALLRVVRPGLDLGGRVSGRVQASGSFGRELRFDGDLAHSGRGGDSSAFHGRGVLAARADSRELDLELDARRIALSELATWYPALAGLHGTATGPIRLRGALNDLALEAALETRAGPIRFLGRLARGRDGPHYQGEARLSAFQAKALLDKLPDAELSGVVAFDLTGTSLVGLVGTLRVGLDSARLARVPLQRSWMEARVADGLLLVDTLHAATLAGDLTGRGSFGLDASRNGTLGFSLRSAAVGLLEADLLGAAASTDATAPRLAGSVLAHGELIGNVEDLNASAEGDVRALVLGPLRLAHAHASFVATGLATPHPRVEFHALADSAAAYRHVLDAARLSVVHEDGQSTFRLHGGAPGVDRLALGGVLARSEDVAQLALHELTLGDQAPWRLVDTVYAQLHGDRLQVSAFDLARSEGSGRLSATGVLAWSPDSTRNDPVDFRIAIEALPFTDVLRLAHSRSTGAGRLDGTLRVTGRALSPLIDAAVTSSGIAYNDMRMERGFLELGYAAEGLELFLEAQHGQRRVFSGGGQVPLDLRFTAMAERRLAQPLELAVTADSLPAVQALALLKGFSGVEGVLNGTLRARGTTLDPALSGEMHAAGLTATWAPTGVRYRDFGGSFRLVSDRVVEVEARTRTEEPRRRLLAGDVGTGTIRGRLDFSELTDPGFDLTFQAEQVHAAKRRDVEARMTGQVHLGGRYREPVVDADLRVDGGTIYIDELYRQFFVVQLDSARMFQFVDTSLVARRRVLPISKNPFLENLNVRTAQLRIGNGSWLRGADLDVEVVGELNVAYNRGADDLRMSGTLDVVRGTYQLVYPPLQARRFQVRSGTIEFPGIPGIDPNLAIEAVYKGRAGREPLDIIAQVSGSLQAPRVRLTSSEEPPISESDLASYLFFGVPTWEVGGLAGAQGADPGSTLAGFGFNTFAPSLLGYASSGLQTLAQSAGLLDYVSLTTAEIGAGSQEKQLANPFATAQLDLGRYLSPTVYAGVSQRLSGSNRELGWRLEWRFQPTFTLELFSEDRFARNAPSFSYDQEALLKRVYGFFLFREWGY